MIRKVDRWLTRVEAPFQSAMARRWRVHVAWCLLPVSVVGWPLSALTWASGEPPFVLGLSWMAIIITAADLVSTAEVHKEQQND